MGRKDFKKGDRVKIDEDHPAPFLSGKEGEVLEYHPMEGLVRIEWDRPHRPPSGMRRDEENVDAQWVKKASKELSLKDTLIRIGSDNPDLREHLRPVLDTITSTDKEGFDRPNYSYLTKSMRRVKSDLSTLIEDVEKSFEYDSETEMLLNDFDREVDQTHELIKDLDPNRKDPSLRERIPKNFKFAVETSRKLLAIMKRKTFGKDLIKRLDEIRDKLSEMKKAFEENLTDSVR